MTTYGWKIRAVRMASGRRYWMWSFVLAFLIVVATSEDPWPVTTASPSSGLLIVAVDDDDSDGNAEHVPPCACGSVDHTSLWSSMRTDCVEPVGLKNDSCLTFAPRGPPDERSNSRGLPESLSSNICPASQSQERSTLRLEPLNVSAVPRHG